MYLREILEKVKSGELSVDEAERRVGLETYADMGYAKLDTAREKRTGFPEVVYCAGKPDEYIVSISDSLKMIFLNSVSSSKYSYRNASSSSNINES